MANIEPATTLRAPVAAHSLSFFLIKNKIGIAKNQISAEIKSSFIVNKD